MEKGILHGATTGLTGLMNIDLTVDDLRPFEKSIGQAVEAERHRQMMEAKMSREVE